MVGGPVQLRDSLFSRSAAGSALYITCKLLVALSYTLGLKTSVLVPQQRLLFLEMVVDTKLQAFLIPEEKRRTFVTLRERLLGHKAQVTMYMSPGRHVLYP